MNAQNPLDTPGRGDVVRTVRTDAPAKINLMLNVKPGHDAAGYHEVQTVMAMLDLHDSVEVSLLAPGVSAAPAVQPAPAAPPAAPIVPIIELSCIPDPLGGADPQRNIAYRAVERLAAEFGICPAVRVSVRKEIPSQAGLGGGSSDAAAVIRCLTALWGIDPADPCVASVARSLGADVPFFLGGPLAFLSGRGDVPVAEFEPFEAPLVLVKPASGVSTPAAYRSFDALGTRALDARGLVDALVAGDFPCALGQMANNMEPASRAVNADLDDVFEFLESYRADLAAAPILCGSGACVAAFTRDSAVSKTIAHVADLRGWWSCVTRTIAKPANLRD